MWTTDTNDFSPALSQKGTTRLILLLFLPSLYFALQPFLAHRRFPLLPFLTLCSFLHVHFWHDRAVSTLQV